MAIDTSQVPAGAKLATGETKQPLGVIEEGFVPNGEILQRQADAVARRLQGAVAWQSGADFPEELTRMVESNSYKGVTNLNQATLDALQNGAITRDQAFVGNNANFTGYYLEPAAKYVIPQLTPLRNMTPRVAGVGIDTINWRAITDYFGGNGPSVATAALQQQGTPTSLTYNWVNASNVMKMLSVKDVVTFEAELYGRMFQGDVRATVAAKLIPALMQEQEYWMINSGQKLWTPPPISNISTATTGGTIAAGTYWFCATAVNANGETLADGGSVPTLTSVTTTGTTSTITFNIFRVPSATKYNVYCGSGNTAPANSALYVQTPASQFGGANALNDPGGLAQGYFTVTMTAAPLTNTAHYDSTVTAGNTAIVVKSTDTNTLNLPLTYDGMQALIYVNRGTKSTLMVGAETPFISQPNAANGSLALSDIDTLLENMFLNAKADPEYLFVSVKDHKKLSLLVANGTNFRVTIPNQDPGLANLVGGQRVTRYVNQTTGRLMEVIMLPYLMQGTIIASSFTIPFPVSAIDKAPWRIEYNRDMWAVEYPPDQGHISQWMYSAFVNECPVQQFLGGQALLTGITLS
jgi:hypothetical protein